MNRARVAEVQKLCGEVAALCKEFEAIELKNDKIRKQIRTSDYPSRPYDYYDLKPTGRASAALKRRSMDLTNALADMRKP